MDILYTPYGLPVEINHLPQQQSAELSVEISTTRSSSFQMIQTDLLQSFKMHKGVEKFKKKLNDLGINNFQVIELPSLNKWQIKIECPFFHRKVETYKKVLKIILKLLLRKFPRYIEQKYGIGVLVELYDDLKVKIKISGNFNIAKVFRVCRTANPYIGFKY